MAKADGGAFKALRFAGLVALAGLGVAVFLVSGSYLFWQSEKKSEGVSQRNLQELRNRLETLKREQADLRGSEETYKSLIARGAFAPEHRLDLIEALAELKKRHRLIGLEYEIAPQRALKFATGTSFSAVGIMASRVHMKLQAYHDGDLVAFLDEFPRIQRGFFPIDKCTIKRVVSVEQRAPTTLDMAARVPQPVTAQPAQAGQNAGLAPSVEADCTLEWITLVDKSRPVAVAAALPKPI
ncbi:MAG: hypothetical protein ABI790_00355 [Betaproteobacteria bacterium]